MLNVYCASMSDLYYYIYNIYFFYTQYYGSVSDFYICLYIYTHYYINYIDKFMSLHAST